MLRDKLLCCAYHDDVNFPPPNVMLAHAILRASHATTPINVPGNSDYPI
jgi:hypothetical protein